MPKFAPAEDVAKIANDLIANVKRFEHLAPAKIEYLVLQSDGKWKNADEPFGYVTIFQGPAAYCSNRDMAIVINLGRWVACEDNEKRRKAIINHIFSHIERGDDTADGYPTWHKIGHPVSFFPDEVAEYGYWNEELEYVDQAVNQMKLFELEQLENEGKALIGKMGQLKVVEGGRS
jgi:hypothetical protein